MNELLIIQTILVAAAIISAVVAVAAWLQNRQVIRLANTPILIPTFRRERNGENENVRVRINNNHDRGIAQHVSVRIFGGKLTREESKTDEFLAPGYGTDIYILAGNPDGCRFEVKYQNIFKQEVQVCGSVHEVTRGHFDLQSINFLIDF
ncbi:MAG: hypothetical protein OQJ98_02265 [Candidatus Pacebacteria bacterium]|nr:hypothetical protein [Candidatus Paceibacterota bacterium]